MNLYRVGKRFVTAFTFLAICIAVSSLETACDAKPGVNQEKTEEQWIGHQGTNKVIFTIKSGGKNATWEYSGTRDCTLEAKDSGTDNDNRKMYVFTSSNGGKCNNLITDVLKLEKQGDGFSYTVTNDKNELIENGTLSKK